MVSFYMKAIRPIVLKVLIVNRKLEDCVTIKKKDIGNVA